VITKAFGKDPTAATLLIATVPAMGEIVLKNSTFP
jgi:hypothetical protein